MEKKIREILCKYNEIGACLWEIGTDFYGSWTKLIKNIQSVQTNNEISSTIEIKKTSIVPKRLSMFYIGQNITPIIKKNKQASESAIRQYLQVGSALNFIFYSEKDKLQGEFFLNFIFNKYLEKEFSLAKHLVETIFISISSPISFIKNLGYSILVCLLNKEEKIPDDICIQRRTNSKNKQYKVNVPKNFNTNQTYAKEYITHVYGENTFNFGSGKGTYITCIKEIMNIESYDFSFIIDELYNRCINIQEPVTTVNEYDKTRTHFRKNVIEQRKIKIGEIYSDLMNSSTNELHIEFLEACHIYEVWKIKHNNDNKEKIKDPDNCILLNSACHTLFDKQIISFDINGKLHCRSENKEDVEKLFGSLEAQIKPEIFNEKMKKYLALRN